MWDFEPCQPPVNLVPSSVNDKKSITETLVVGMRNSHTQELRIIEKGQAVNNCHRTSNDLNSGTSKSATTIGYDLSNLRISLHITWFMRQFQRICNINNNMSGIFLWPHITFSFFWCKSIISPLSLPTFKTPQCHIEIQKFNQWLLNWILKRHFFLLKVYWKI